MVSVHGDPVGDNIKPRIGLLSVVSDLEWAYDLPVTRKDEVWCVSKGDVACCANRMLDLDLVDAF